MKRAVIHGPRVAALEELSRPTPAPGEYLVAVEACGICTWEQRVHRGVTARYPFAPGHEVGGVIASAPDEGLAIGTVVAVSLLPRCGRCMACELGLDNLCAYLTGHGGGEGPGGLSEYLAVDASDVIPLARDRTPVEAALVEPLACVLNSLSVAGVEHGSKLAVVGNGFMGILHARAAEAMGAEVTLVQTGPFPAGLERAWEGSLQPLQSLGVAFADRVPAAVDGAFDAAIVIRGIPQSAIAAAHLVRPGGVVSIYASLPSGEDIGLPGQLLRRKQISLTAAASHRRVDFVDAARWIGDGTVVVADLVHCTYPLAEVQEALMFADELDSGRVVVTLGGADAARFA